MSWLTGFEIYTRQRVRERADETARRLRRKDWLARVVVGGRGWYVMIAQPRIRRAQQRWL